MSSMSSFNLAVILFTVFLSACAQLVLKLGVSKSEGGLGAGGLSGLLEVLFSPFVIGGIFIYGVSVLIWLWVLSRVDLSVAYPFVGVSFIFTLAFGYFILSEPINTSRVVGTVLIAIGCVFVARS